MIENSVKDTIKAIDGEVVVNNTAEEVFLVCLWASSDSSEEAMEYSLVCRIKMHPVNKSCPRVPSDTRVP